MVVVVAVVVSVVCFCCGVISKQNEIEATILADLPFLKLSSKKNNKK